jgi:hypothetical protein
MTHVIQKQQRTPLSEVSGSEKRQAGARPARGVGADPPKAHTEAGHQVASTGFSFIGCHLRRPAIQDYGRLATFGISKYDARHAYAIGTFHTYPQS